MHTEQKWRKTFTPSRTVETTT